MNETLSSLNIEVKANVEDATSNLEKVITSLERLGNAVPSSVAENIYVISQSTKELTKSCYEAIVPIKEMVNTLKQTAVIGQSLDLIQNGFERLFNVTNTGFSWTLMGISEIGKSLESMNATISGVSKDLEETKSTIKGIGEQSKQTSKNIDEASESTGKFALVGNSLTTISFVFNQITSAVKKLAGVWYKLKASLGSSLELSNAYIENIHIMNVAFGETTNLTAYVSENIDSVTDSFGSMSTTLKEVNVNAQEYVEILHNLIGIDESTLAKNLGTLSALATGFGLAREEANKLAQGLNELAYDISSFYNMKFDDAVATLKSGVSGVIKGVRSLGFAIDDATLKQEALAHGITISTQEMTTAQKATLRYVTLLKQAKSMGIVGDFAKTLQTPANSIRILKEELTTLSRTLGNVFQPILVQVLPYLHAFVKLLTEALGRLATFLGYKARDNELATSFENMSDNVDDATASVKKLKQATMGFDELNVISKDDGDGGSSATNSLPSDLGLDISSLWDEAVFDAITKQTDEYLENIKTKLSEIKKQFSETFSDPKVIESLQAVAGWVTAIGVAFGLIKLASSPLGQAIGAIFTNWDWSKLAYGLQMLQSSFMGFFTSIGGFATKLVSLLNPVTVIIALVAGLFVTAYLRSEELRKSVSDFVGMIGSTFIKLFERAKKIVSDVVAIFKSFWEVLVLVWNNVADALTPVFMALMDALKLLWVTVINPIADAIGTVLVGAFDAVTNTVVNYFIPLVKTIIEICHPIVEFLGSVLGTLIEGALTILSPFFESIGFWIEFTGGVVSGLIDTIFSVLNSVLSFLNDVFSGDWAKIWDNLAKVWSDWWEAIQKDFLDMIEQFKQFGKFLIDGLIEGVKNQWENLKKTVTNIANGVTDWFKNALGIHSPSRVMADNGEYVVRGLVEGIDDTAKKAKTSINDLCNMITNEFNKWARMFTENFNRKLSDLYSNAIKKTNESWGTIKNTWQIYTNSLVSMNDSAMNTILKKIENTMASIENAVNSAQRSINQLERMESQARKLSESISDLKSASKEGKDASVKAYASGGVVSSGQLFIARESGAELVGSFGNTTGVMNNAQIVQAVSQGVASAVAQVMQNQSGQNITIELDGEVLYRSNNKVQKKLGYNLGL